MLERNSGYILDSKEVSCHFSLKFTIFKFQFSFISSATQSQLHLIAAERYSTVLYAEISGIKKTLDVIRELLLKNIPPKPTLIISPNERDV